MWHTSTRPIVDLWYVTNVVLPTIFVSAMLSYTPLGYAFLLPMYRLYNDINSRP